MSDAWKKWEGQVVDHKYQLQQWLGSTDHSVVFLAEVHDPEPRQVAIKFISADQVDRQQQIAAWKHAAELNHPNLLQIYGGGFWKMEDMDLLYVAMEYAEENLAQVVPHRALMAEETKEMLNAASDVLVYLHGKNLVHGHVKPSNVLATGEVLKLSSDTIFPAGEVREMRRERSAYDAPELPNSAYTSASDVWSLGITLVEAFTQQPAVLPFNEESDPIIPPVVREPFLEITRHALQREPTLRWSSAKIAERLNPAAAAARSAAAGAGSSVRAMVGSTSALATGTVTATPEAPPPPVMSPLNVPLSKEPAVPLAKQPPVPPVRTAIGRPRSRAREVGEPPKQTVVLPNYAIPLFAGLLALIALIALVFGLRPDKRPQVAASKTAVSASSPSAAATPPSSSVSNLQPSAKLPPAKPAPAVTATSPARPQPATPTPAPAVLRDKGTSPAQSPKNSNSSSSKGEALDQVAPEASAKALSTIKGTVRVGVKVHVDAAGNVSDASFENPGPSKYFGDLALKAARRWVFTPPEVDGRSVASDWLIQFHFTQAGVQGSAQQVVP
jgi:TonB family protein